jgi:hypothetical protein
MGPILIALILGGVFAQGCRHAKENSLLDAGTNTPEKKKLTASDVSILVPLKANTARDRIFEIEGDGFCNALKLDFGGSNPILSQSHFDNIKANAYSKLPPFRINPFGSDEVLRKVNNELRNAPTESASCASPFLPSDLNNVNDRSFLKSKNNLAMIRDLPQEVCDYTNWRVVGLRFDPCLASAEMDDFFTKGSFPKDRCPTREVRLVVQPFTKCPTCTNWRSIDATMHLLYDLDDPAAFITDLRKFARVSATHMDSGWGKISSDRTLIPHPGLRSEMNCSGTIGPIGQAYRNLVKKYANPQTLNGAAMMTADRVLQHWSFTTVRVKSRGLPRSFFSFAVGAVDRFLPFSPSTASVNIYDIFTPGTLTGANARRLGSLANRVQNPRLITQVPDRTNRTSDCLSCHLSEQALQKVAEASDFSISKFGPTPFKRTIDGTATAPPRWTGFDRRFHNLNNLRNFGYIGEFEFGVSLRVTNETDSLLQTIETYFP